VDAPQLPGAESSAPTAGGQPPGQASAFRRALDAQIEPSDQSTALVPAGPHDVTRPIDVKALREALAAEQAGATTIADMPLAELPIVLPTAPASLPSPSGPAVVVPTVAVPELRGATTIAARTPNAVSAYGGSGSVGGNRDVASVSPTVGPERGHGDEHEHDRSPKHSGGNGKPSRLPTTIGLSVLLAAIAATALVLIDVGRSAGPLAPSAMPTKSVGPSSAAQPPHAAAPSHKSSPSAPAKHSPSHSPSPSVDAAKPSTGPSSVESFIPLVWTNDFQPMVADIQSRLAKLHYLSLGHDAAQYDVTQRTMGVTGNRWWHPTDGIGYYQNATISAIRAFKFDYLQHDQGQPPGDGSCDPATYQALVNATN
jgi:hypothetical protein